MNKWQGYGRISYIGEMKYKSGDNTPIINLSIACKTGNSTEFVSCAAFGKTAEIIEKYFHKGNRVVAEGYLKNNEYTDKNGNKIKTQNTIVTNVEFVETKAESGNDQTMGNVGGDNMPIPSGDGFMNIPNGAMDELPFS